MQVLKRLIYLLALLPMMMLNSCAEDDVNEIFVSGQWALINYYNNIDWGGKLNNQGFVSKAPAQVVDGVRAQLARAEDKKAQIEASIKALS